MKKVLFLVSVNTAFKHRSGETELKILQIGFRLLGYQCDIVNVEANDFEDYDIYVAFSLNKDLDVYLNTLKPDKTLLLYTQTEQFDLYNMERIKNILSLVKNSYIVARDTVEKEFYARILNYEKIIWQPSYFLEPFVSKASAFDLLPVLPKFGLSFIGEYKNSDFKKIVKECKKNSYKMIVLSSEVEHCQWLDETLFLHPRIDYGSETWVSLLQKCSFFFEVNSRLTTGILEAFYFSKPIISGHCNAINSIVKANIVYPNLLTVASDYIKDQTFNLAAYRVENILFQVQQILNEQI